MERMTLVIMAAGRGSRFGGPKQIAEIDGRGHRIIDYSVYDGVREGFRRVVFVTSREIEPYLRPIAEGYREQYGIDVDFAYQDTDSLPDSFAAPEGRAKPFGTAHAVACLEGMIDSPFALINADDFYGRDALKAIFSFLTSGEAVGQSYAMVGYRLGNTLSENGSVSRGVCSVEKGFLTGIEEKRGIIKEKGRIFCDSEGKRALLDPSATVSVNLWGFTPHIIGECARRFSSFLKENISRDPLGCEFYLPVVISELLSEGRARVRVLDCDSVWQGVTYKSDREGLSGYLSHLVKIGEYPACF